MRRPPRSPLLPSTPLFRSGWTGQAPRLLGVGRHRVAHDLPRRGAVDAVHGEHLAVGGGDRKSTRLNSSHRTTSYAVFCMKKKKRTSSSASSPSSCPTKYSI